MAMPWQLAEGLKRRPKGKYTPRPIVEQLLQVSINDLKVPRDNRSYVMPNASLRYGFITHIRLSWDAIEFTFPSLHRVQLGRTQTFRLKHIRTGIGAHPRHAFVCDCKRATIKLYSLNGYPACKRCHNAINASQAIASRDRPVLQAIRIQNLLDTKPRLFRHTQERLRRRLGDKALMPQGKLGTHIRNNLWK